MNEANIAPNSKMSQKNDILRRTTTPLGFHWRNQMSLISNSPCVNEASVKAVNSEQSKKALFQDLKVDSSPFYSDLNRKTYNL